MEAIQSSIGGLSWPPLARFAAVATLVLLVPIVARRLRLPDCVGYIAGGILLGPFVLGILPQHGEIAEFFAELGKLLLMFFVGMEVDIRQFIAQRRRALGGAGDQRRRVSGSISGSGERLKPRISVFVVAS